MYVNNTVFTLVEKNWNLSELVENLLNGSIELRELIISVVADGWMDGWMMTTIIICAYDARLQFDHCHLFVS